MVELVVTIAALVVGLFFTVRALVRISREAEVVNGLNEPTGSPAWLLVREKLILMVLVALGQGAVMLVVILILSTDPPRPPAVAATIRWSIVSLIGVLTAISIHAERSYHRETEALGLASNGNKEEM